MDHPEFRRPMSRRQFGAGAAVAAAAGAAASLIPDVASARSKIEDLVAQPPTGFTPMTAPGRVVKVAAKGDFASIMQNNQLWPKADVAKGLFERTMMELTGAPNAVEAMKRFVHKDDIVAIKVNGIAGQKGMTMAVNFELIEPVVQAVLAVGVPAEHITVYEQYPSYLIGTRVNFRNWKLPAGVQTGTHNNNDHVMPEISVYQGIKTKYCRFFTRATAVIDMTQMKDHSICGYTGTLKNITHGNINNPQDHHEHNASPQIAMLYNHPIVTSRVRLHITDAFKITYDGGPLDKRPECRIAHGAVYASTDPVALDTVGWQVIDQTRKAHGLKSLKDAKREPRYVTTAGEFGLGVRDLNKIDLRTTEI